MIWRVLRKSLSKIGGMKFIHVLNNIKCNGCAHSISKKISTFKGVDNVTVDVSTGKVSFNARSLKLSNVILSALGKMGYTKDSPTIADTAKSYFSCAVGKVGYKLES